MRQPRVPSNFIGGIASLPDLLRSIAKGRGLSDQSADDFIVLIPENLRTSPCFLDRLTSLWRYDFGEPFDGLPNGRLVVGTHMYLSIEQLFDVLLFASRRLSQKKLSDYLTRLDDPNKHADLVFEFAPVIRLPDATRVAYEVVGYGEGATTVDWLLNPQEGTPMLLEVKNRTRDLWESFMRLDNGERDAQGNAPAPTHDTSLLFRNIERKFMPRSTGDLQQGAWIGTGIKQEEEELKAAFAALDRSKVHFAVLGDFREDVYVLSDDDQVRENVLKILRCNESNRFVFSRRERATN